MSAACPFQSILATIIVIYWQHRLEISDASLLQGGRLQGLAFKRMSVTTNERDPHLKTWISRWPGRKAVHLSQECLLRS